MSGIVRIAIVLVVAAAATIIANVVLLGVATGPHDPVGRLSPAAAPPKVSAPRRPVVPAVHRREQEWRDD